MSEASQHPKTYARCLVEAAAWRAQLAERELETAPEFESWLAADDDHRNAWEQLSGPWDLLAEHATTPAFVKLRREALEVAHSASSGQSPAVVGRFGASKHLRVTLSAAAAILVAIVGLLFWAFDAPTVYRTGSGERRVATLSDGSQVELDSSSEVRVRYSDQARELWLRKGQARFVVMHGDRRPFEVVVGAHKVIATGTSFDIDTLDSALYVTLLEGHVRVVPESGTPRVQQQTELDPGQQLVVTSQGDARVVPANLERVLAWRNGQMVFDDEPLATALERVNRYSAQPLVLADEKVGELRISGVFHTNNIRGFVDTLTSYLPVAADRQRDKVVLRAVPGG